MNTLIKLSLNVLFVLFSVTANSKGLPKTDWKTGDVQLWNNSTLSGALSYNWLTETVLFRETTGQVRAFSAHQVRQFSWFDTTQNKRREFLSLAKGLSNNRKSQAFYELCMNGPLTVIRRLRRPHGLFKRTFNYPANFSDTQTLAQNPDQFDYFVYDDGQFKGFDQFYTDIYTPYLSSYDHALRQYQLTHNINERTVLGRLVLINQYNFLVQQDQKTASIRQPGTMPK